ncbi:MAG: hypothetical protein R2821_09945 [Flavobacteriaceae bacterium]|jgi:hypothetical protein|nr:hypothetical protein [Flavobacteriaceae bacterium]MCB0485402.1 hypothetical protein [Flavobacteriaceae bacterium]
MKTLILTLSLIVATEFFAQPFNDYNSIVSVEEETPFEFNTADYLPLGFDPYKGMIEDESSLLIEEPVKFDFDTKEYLPEGFDPYEGMIQFERINTEDEAVFDFNTKDYLPVGFNPYRKDGTTVVAS